MVVAVFLLLFIHVPYNNLYISFFSSVFFFLWSKIVRLFASFSFCVCHFTRFLACIRLPWNSTNSLIPIESHVLFFSSLSLLSSFLSSFLFYNVVFISHLYSRMQMKVKKKRLNIKETFDFRMWIQKYSYHSRLAIQLYRNRIRCAFIRKKLKWPHQTNKREKKLSKHLDMVQK